MVDFFKLLGRVVGTIFHSYSEIFFLRSTSAGFLFFLITMFNPNVALSGLISVAAAYIFARFVNMGESFLDTGFYTYNPLLVGLSIGYLFRITPLTIFFLIAMGIFTYIISVILYYVFYTYFRLPVLSLPFVLVTSISYLASSQFTNLFVTSLYPHYPAYSLDLNLPFWLTGYFIAFGAIFFLPYVIPGIIIAGIVLIKSRILFLMSILGYFTGTIIEIIMVGSSHEAFANINNFNFILIAMAIGAIYLVPSIKSYIIAMIAVGIATIFLESVLVFWSSYAIPGFTLPFNIISLSFIYMLGLIQYPEMIPVLKSTPEEALDNYITNRRRFHGHPIGIMLPFSGSWTVWQAFDDEWTHKGNWKYAYDFIITDHNGNSYEGDGSSLNQYYCYNKPVLAPIRGRIVKVIDEVIDNPPGVVDKTNNWGNLIVIQSEEQYFVEISHLANNSIRCKEGDWVERGSFLGFCGNSGFSPQPHIHIQVQVDESIGTYTIPFSFISFVSDGKMFSHENPPKGAVVEPLHWDKYAEARTSFALDDVLEYRVLRDGQEIDRLHLSVNLETDGTYFLNSGKGKLYFGNNEGTFYHYGIDGEDHYLPLFMQAIPRLPLAYRNGLTWTDSVPANAVLKPVKKIFTQLIQAFYINYGQIDAHLKYENENEIRGTITTQTSGKTLTTLAIRDKFQGFSKIRVDKMELERIHENN